MSAFSIQTNNLSKRFYPAKNLKQFVSNVWGKAPAVTAVDRVNLKIGQGESCVLVGPNGAGKTTLIKILAGLILPTEGSAEINGYDVYKHEIRIKDSVGFLTGEERSFYWRLTGRENLVFFAALYNLRGDHAKKRIADLAAFLKIKELDRRFQEYS